MAGSNSTAASTAAVGPRRRLSPSKNVSCAPLQRILVAVAIVWVQHMYVSAHQIPLNLRAASGPGNELRWPPRSRSRTPPADSHTGSSAGGKMLVFRPLREVPWACTSVRGGCSFRATCNGTYVSFHSLAHHCFAPSSCFLPNLKILLSRQLLNYESHAFFPTVKDSIGSPLLTSAALQTST